MKILLLSRLKHQNPNSVLYEYIKSQGHDVYFADPREINMIFSRNDVRVFYDGINISDIEMVISRNSRGLVEKIDEIVKIFKSKGAVIFGHEEDTPFSYRKFGNHFKLLEYFPETIYFSKSNKDNVLGLLDEVQIEMPFILKPEGASRGIGVKLIENKNDYDAYFKDEEVQEFSDFIIQEYLDISNEYRVFVLGKKSLGICEKIGDGIAKNFAQGSKFVYLRDEKLESFAESLAQKLNHHTLGFDIIRTRKGDLKVIEVNSWANFTGFEEASGINMPEKIINYFIEYTKKKYD